MVRATEFEPSINNETLVARLATIFNWNERPKGYISVEFTAIRGLLDSYVLPLEKSLLGKMILTKAW